MAPPEATMEVGPDGVAVITIFNPPVNALAIPVITGLKKHYKEAMSRDDVKAIVLTGKGGKFSGGFDINVFQKVQASGDTSVLPDESVDVLVNTIEDAKKPSFAAVERIALGGGLELTLACHGRVAAPKAQLGLPELSLGIIPGFGGTQRFPRLVGPSKAVAMMLSSKPIFSEGGNRLGLIDHVVPFEEFLKVSRLLALDIAERRKPWVCSLQRTDRIGSLCEAREILKLSKEEARKIAPNLPQHLACLDVIEDGIIHGGCSEILKVPTITDVGLKPTRVKEVAIIGGGLMGCGIATALILSNIYVLKEINSEYLLKGIKSIEVWIHGCCGCNKYVLVLPLHVTANLRGLVTRGKLSKDKVDKCLSLLKGVLDYSEFKDVDLVIEAVIEKSH